MPCPNGHDTQPGDSHCGHCGTALAVTEDQQSQEPGPTSTSDASYHKRLAILGVLIAAVCIGIIVVSTRGGGSETSDRDSTSTAWAENEATQFGCEITPMPDLGKDITQVDPTCTEGGVLTQYCPDVPPDLLKVPAYDTRQGPGTLTNVYVVGDTTYDGGDALVTHYIPSTANPTNDGTRITCPSGEQTYFTRDEWQAFTRAG
jgi:hypothetical protein